MVATDVASRGIGMLDCIFVSPLFFMPSFLLTLCGFVCTALLSTTDYYVYQVVWSGLLMYHWVLLSGLSWSPSAV